MHLHKTTARKFKSCQFDLKCKNSSWEEITKSAFTQGIFTRNSSNTFVCITWTKSQFSSAKKLEGEKSIWMRQCKLSFQVGKKKGMNYRNKLWCHLFLKRLRTAPAAAWLCWLTAHWYKNRRRSLLQTLQASSASSSDYTKTKAANFIVSQKEAKWGHFPMFILALKSQCFKA